MKKFLAWTAWRKYAQKEAFSNFCAFVMDKKTSVVRRWNRCNSFCLSSISVESINVVCWDGNKTHRTRRWNNSCGCVIFVVVLSRNILSVNIFSYFVNILTLSLRWFVWNFCDYCFCEFSLSFLNSEIMLRKVDAYWADELKIIENWSNEELFNC